MQELHSIKPFRETNLGIIRLKKLAYPDNEKMKIMIGEKQVFPVGFDTYGHPIISESNFAYYQAQKANTERRGESFVPIVEYKEYPFCIRRDVYDSVESLVKALSEPENALKSLKKILIYRKQAAFCKKELDTFLLYNKYVLASDGHIYAYNSTESYEEDVIRIDIPNGVSDMEEIHLPGEDDVCDICGKKFTIEDIKNFSVSENSKCLKVHKNCLADNKEAIEYHEASKIIDSVYEGRPKSEIIIKHDKNDEDMKTWYVYKTNQGTIAIRFKRKVIVIEWYDNFKPFNMSIFDDERVTKYDRGIHAWSREDAIRYLLMAKKA